MGVLPVYALPLLLTAGAAPTIDRGTQIVPVPSGSLSAEDARYLDWLVEDFLFDPQRAIYVRIAPPGRPRERDLILRGQRIMRLRDRDAVREGWLVKGTKGEGDRIYFADGDSVAVGDQKIRQLDFEDECRRRYYPGQSSTKQEFDRLIRLIDDDGESDLVLAAWLHRRGHDRLAATALAAVREDENQDPRLALRYRLAMRALGALVDAFCIRADADALAHADRLFRLYPEEAAAETPQAEAIASDLRRRQHAGTSGRVPPKSPPAGFAAWANARKIEFLIGSLDEIENWDAGGIRHRSIEDISTENIDDWRVAALKELGDAAIPALIDAYEHDGRLIRHRDEESSRNGQVVFRGNRLVDLGVNRVAEVRPVLLYVIRSILRTRHWDPAEVDQRREKLPPPIMAAKLRRYWANYGHLNFDDRMMTILTDRSSKPLVRRDAAACLVAAHQPGDRQWSRANRQDAVARPSSLVTKYRNPSVAEAILAALDDHRAQWESQKDERGYWAGIERRYLESLKDLGDHRVGPEIARRVEAARNLEERLELARAARMLGVSGPMVRVCREMASGNVWVPSVGPGNGAPPQFDKDSTLDLLVTISNEPLAEADDALFAVAEKDHPYFPFMSKCAIDRWNNRRYQFVLDHPYHITLLRNLLTDTTPTGGHYFLRGDEIEELRIGRRPDLSGLPTTHADPRLWHEHVEQRVADVAADKLSDFVFGLPEYHPLRRDADRVLIEMRTFLMRYDRRFRDLTREEHFRFELHPNAPEYIPDIRPLGRLATATDVARGDAVFEQKGQGRVADVKMPAWLVLKSNAKNEDPAVGLIVQAELGPDGKATYGVIFRNAIRAVRADEVERIEPYGSPKKKPDPSVQHGSISP
ncbi:MAG TPA: hypothetical protein VHR66_28195 [Gemmataceae bacterium]|jgi:hypothetical protein|nr:hypothetical protein [Gemmataceae bacterium]